INTMSKTIVLKKGLNIPVKGEAGLALNKTVQPATVAIRPCEFKGLLPRLLVREGDAVLAGSPVLSDKKNPDILIASPVSGTVKQVVRGEKRKLLAVLIEADQEQKYFDFGAKSAASLDADQVKAELLRSGLWAWMIQRPYGIIANPATQPKAIFVSAFDSAPLAADSALCFGAETAAIQAAIDALAKIAEVHVSFDAKTYSGSSFEKLTGCTKHFFEGKHPAGNVGVQISHISPIRKDEIVWTVSLLGLAAIGRLFLKGRYDVSRKVAICGPMAIEPCYIKSVPGMPVKAIQGHYGTCTEDIRIVSGSILTGEAVGTEGYLGFYDNQISVLREGVEPELFGWIRPLRYKQFSTDHTYFSWLTPWRKYDLDTCLHGGPRAFIMNDNYYAKVLPMDIYPLYLVKACLAGDIEKMEKFGIYEVLPEDLALCEYVDPSKNYIQDIVAKGIDLMLKEMA
ncbi:MAG: Na(+)-translocating NADH-quinone reductase subunit A, partial [Bacteroidales bacterium]|nr:Na(+)-translocating NADH-quinone reductase subunit A [Candidatus Cryptobacteroides aphodequi]